MTKILFVCFLNIFLCELIFAAQVPTGQGAGLTAREYMDEKSKEEAVKRLITPKVVPPALDEQEIEALPDDAKSVYISKIIIQQDSFLVERIEEDLLSELTEGYKDRSLTLRDMKALAVRISQETSQKKIKAYIPKQSFSSGIMYINLIAKF